MRDVLGTALCDLLGIECPIIQPEGVNRWLHTALRPPVDRATISDDRRAAAHSRAERAPRPARARRPVHGPGAVPDVIAAQIEVIPEEPPPVFPRCVCLA
jgi:hypothetical protein